MFVSRSEWSNNAFIIFETFVYDQESRKDKSEKLNSFSNRMMKRLSINTHVAFNVLKKWVEIAKLKLDSLISLKETKHKVLCLLYYYKHLDEKDLKNLLCTNLIIHRVWIVKETKSTLNLTQKRWSAHSEWWLRKIIQNDIKENIYELTELINERLFRWNVKAVIVDKVANFTLKNELRITFNYFRVTKNLLDTFMKLSSKIHNNLTDSKHECLMIMNLKHAYLTINMHSEDKHYFAFIISEIDQLQSIRMQQESQSVEFIMMKTVYWAFKILSSLLQVCLVTLS